MERIARAVVLASVLALLPASAAAQSLPSVSSGHRPGPDILYADAPRVPQLQNQGIWRADPILVSGASAYRAGEFLYQDFLYDDHGARGTRDPTDPFSSEEFAFSPKYGTLTYPTDAAYANNAADLVELRVKPQPGETAFRVTLNTLKDPGRAAFTIALGSSSAPREWPHQAGVSSPADRFLTVHGTSAELTDAATGATLSPAPSATVDAERNQVEVRVPHAAWRPAGKVRMAAGVGLWDAAAGRYAQPLPAATQTAPGGAAPSQAALFNLAFRFDEPIPEPANPAINTIVEGAIGAGADGAWWRERGQAEALADGDAGPYFAEVDFDELESGATDESGVPRTGPVNRILASRFSFGEGVDHRRDCSKTFSQEFPCDGRFLGHLQPYSLHVPAKAVPPRGFGLTLLMHGLSGNHNEFLDTRHTAQLADRGTGTIVVSPLGRGPDGFYQDMAEADVFEVWADVARNYRLDPAWATASGFSMGGIGSYRLGYRWPDLFARLAPIVGRADELEQLPSLRNVPLIAWNAGQDELVSPALYLPTLERLAELRLHHLADVFSPAGHITLAANDDYAPQAGFLGTHRVDRDPARVTYVVAPGRNSARALAVADHAYWLSSLRVRGGETGTVDARSLAFGEGEPAKRDVGPTAGTLTGGNRPLAFVRRGVSWEQAPRAARANELGVRLDDLSRATVAGDRARLDGDEPLTVRLRSDGSARVRLNVALAAGSTVERVEGGPVPGAASARRARAAAAAPEAALDRRGATFTVASGSRAYVIRPPGRGGDGAGGADDGGGGGDGGAANAGGGSLPFTGFALLAPLLLGAGLLAAGAALRRRLGA